MRSSSRMAVASLLSLCAPLAAAAPGDRERLTAEWKQWHDARIEELRAPQGWLALSGLQWLAPGANQLEAPAGLPGLFVLQGNQVTLQAEEHDGWTLNGAKVATRALASDKAGRPDRLVRGDVAVQVIDRGGKLALRSWDARRPARASFTGVETFPFDPRWQIEARWEAYAAPREVLVPSMIGVPTRELAPGRVHFVVDGAEQTLEPVLEGGALFFVFKDKTAPGETYGGGRFLHAEPARDGVVRLDFNRAENPPCVFTTYATCPLPLPQNQLPIRIEAGEKLWGHGH